MKRTFDLNKIVICPICKKQVRIGDTMSGRYSGVCVWCYEKERGNRK